MGSILKNSQDYLSGTQQSLIDQQNDLLASAKLRETEAASQRSLTKEALKQTQDQLDFARQSASAEAAASAEKIRKLEQQLHRTEAELAEEKTAANDLREVLDEWIVSQTAFKNLFKKFGKLPDDTPVADLPAETRIGLVNQEIQSVKEQRKAEDSPKRGFQK